MNKPLDAHDVRQSAYRGQKDQAEQGGIPDGKQRHDPSAADGPLSDDSLDNEAPNPNDGAQPDMGQAGSYGAHNEQTEVTSRNRVDPDES